MVLEFRSPRIAADKTAHAAEFQHDPDGALSALVLRVGAVLRSSGVCEGLGVRFRAFLHVGAAVSCRYRCGAFPAPRASCVPPHRRRCPFL